LFAGSGALGLEALSRGAQSALLVEQNRAAVEIIRENLAKTRLQGGQARQAEVFHLLKSLAAAGEQFDLVFADPPYAQERGGDDLAAKLAASEDLRKIVRPGGHFVLECRVTKGGCSSWSGWHTERDREHGSTRIVWLRKPDDETNEPCPL
jgi:16S rRNA (guanine966-N2)-methyltransferase